MDSNKVDNDDDDDDVIVLENYSHEFNRKKKEKKLSTRTPAKEKAAKFKSKFEAKEIVEIEFLSTTDESSSPSPLSSSSLSVFNSHGCSSSSAKGTGTAEPKNIHIASISTSTSTGTETAITNSRVVNQDIQNETGAMNVDIDADNIQSADEYSYGSNDKPQKNRKVTIFFLHKGRSMSSARIELLKKSIEKKVTCTTTLTKTLTTTSNNENCSNQNQLCSYEARAHEKQHLLEIMTDFPKDNHGDGAFLPNYIIVDGTLSLENVCSGLGFQNAQEMAICFNKVSI